MPYDAKDIVGTDNYRQHLEANYTPDQITAIEKAIRNCSTDDASRNPKESDQKCLERELLKISSLKAQEARDESLIILGFILLG
ncbi:MAG: hypothetical protein ACFFEN_03470 [Candidatus Thorarchaeota archaeon]